MEKLLNTKDTPLVLATDWQLGKCGSSLSSSIICTTDSDKFLFQTEEATTYPAHLKRAVRRCTLKQSAVQGGRRAPGWNQQFHDQPSSLYGCTVFPCLSPPLLLIYKIVFQAHYCFTYSLLGRKYFYAIKILLVFFYSLLIHAKQESMTHCLLWLQKIQTKVLNVLRQLYS